MKWNNRSTFLNFNSFQRLKVCNGIGTYLFNFVRLLLNNNSCIMIANRSTDIITGIIFVFSVSSVLRSVTILTDKEKLNTISKSQITNNLNLEK